MTISGEVATSWQLPTRRAAAWLWVRISCHVLWRGLLDLRGITARKLRKHRVSDMLKDAPVIAEQRSALWQDGRDEELPLVAGKVHNLRMARPAFDGIVVPAGRVFSFWRQLGRPSRLRGFVEGREIRAGCVVPTIAGGLCQLSNALATCAAKAGITLMERHGHTAQVERSAVFGASGDIDATVFWNYVDLRFTADFDFRVDVDLSSDELVVRLRAARPAQPWARLPRATVVPIDADAAKPRRPVARGCLTCDQTSCFRHRPPAARRAAGSTAVLVNDWTPEFARHLGGLGGDADWFIPWVRPARRHGGAWTPPASRQHTVALLASIRRTLHLRRHAAGGGARQAAILQGNRWLADRYARRLEAHHTHLVLDQDLLVPLMMRGALGGRTYEVLVHALPAIELQRRLDVAAHRWPDASSLTDFRVSDAQGAMELAALRGAHRLVTPHAEIARYLQATLQGPLIDVIEWALPTQPAVQRIGRTSEIQKIQAGQATQATPLVAFPASALARKGAHELAEAMRSLGWRLLVLGSPPSDARLWNGIDVAYGFYRDPRWLAQVDMVALPAHVEHSPRGLLAALAQGLPVVASPACGLPPSLNAIEVPAGDVPALIAALQRAWRSCSGDGERLPSDR